MRKPDELRRIEIIRNFTKYAAGSVLVKWGDTWVLCTASVEEKVPPFLRDTGRGWVTAEYAMLPSSTGGMVALNDAVAKLMADGTLAENPIRRQIAAVSVGVCDGVPTLDLDYAHDSTAEVDLNVVMTDDGRFVELQGTAEHEPFTEAALDALKALAKKGIGELFALQKGV